MSAAGWVLPASILVSALVSISTAPDTSAIDSLAWRRILLSWLPNLANGVIAIVCHTPC